MNSSWGRALGKTLMKSRKKFKPEFKSTRWNIVTGDEVRVMNGPQSGQQGNVLAVIRKQNRIIVDGVNMRKRAVKTNDGSPGKMITKPVAMSYANVMLIDPSNGYVFFNASQDLFSFLRALRQYSVIYLIDYCDYLHILPISKALTAFARFNFIFINF